MGRRDDGDVPLARGANFGDEGGGKERAVEWKETLLKLVPQAEKFLGQVESSAQLQRASYHDVRMKKWHGERVVILGDAAHALSP